VKTYSTKHLSLVTGLAGLLLTGCVNPTPAASPTQSRGLSVEARSSAYVRVAPPRLQMNRGNLELAGSISQQPGPGSTAFSHLDVIYFNSSGEVLRTKPVRFAPHCVGHSRFATKVGYYAVDLRELPAGTALIEVRAHDGGHSGQS